MSIKDRDALQLPKQMTNQLGWNQVNPATTPKSSTKNNNTKYIENYHVEESNPLAVENFGFDQSNRSNMAPINVKKFNTATFDANKGIVGDAMAADNSGKLDASKTKADFVNVMTPEIQIRDIKGETHIKDDLKVNEKLSDLSVKRQIQSGRGFRDNPKPGRILKKAKKGNKVNKLSGVVDLDMSGDVDSDIERNARAFTGGNVKGGTNAKIYANRRDARRSTKG